MRLSLDLKYDTIMALFGNSELAIPPMFPGPVAIYEGTFYVAAVVERDERFGFKPVQRDEFGDFIGSHEASLDLSIPWVHEHVAATCLRLLGVQNVRAACMTRPPTAALWPPTSGLWTLRWVDGVDGLPRTASWRLEVRTDGEPTTARSCMIRQNDITVALAASKVKRPPVPALIVKPDANEHQALAALMVALDKRTVPS